MLGCPTSFCTDMQFASNRQQYDYNYDIGSLFRTMFFPYSPRPFVPGNLNNTGSRLVITYFQTTRHH